MCLVEELKVVRRLLLLSCGNTDSAILICESHFLFDSILSVVNGCEFEDEDRDNRENATTNEDS